MATLRVGDKAPEFTLPASSDKEISLKDFRGRKVILYFYPKDDTSGCTKEACSFRDNLKIIEKKGAVVIGVSTDSIESHDTFASKYDLPFPLVSDSEKSLVKKYGVWQQKSMYGRKYMGTVRSTFVIDERGVISHIFPKVKVEGHVEELLSLL